MQTHSWPCILYINCQRTLAIQASVRTLQNLVAYQPVAYLLIKLAQPCCLFSLCRLSNLSLIKLALPLINLVAYSACRLSAKQHACTLQLHPWMLQPPWLLNNYVTKWWVWPNYTRHFRYEWSSDKRGFGTTRIQINEDLDKGGSTVVVRLKWVVLLIPTYTIFKMWRSLLPAKHISSHL